MIERLIFTTCRQTGCDRYDQAYATIDVEIKLPEKIKGLDLKEWFLVGVELQEVTRNDD